MLQVFIRTFFSFIEWIGEVVKRRLYKQRKRLTRGKARRRRSRKGSSGVLLDKHRLKKWSLEIRKLDEYKCAACGKAKKQMHAHHVVSKNFRPQYAYDISNGITLCKSCHMGRGGVHSKEQPKNSVVSDLRTIFWKKNIKLARLYIKKLRDRKGK